MISQSFWLLTLLYPPAYRSFANWMNNLRRVSGLVWTQAPKPVPTEPIAPALKFSTFKTDHALLYHCLHTRSFLTTPELFPRTDPQQEPTCCTSPGDTGASGRACPGETRGSHAADSDPHPAQENTDTVSSKAREGAAPAMKSNGQLTELGPIYLADTARLIA